MILIMNSFLILNICYCWVVVIVITITIIIIIINIQITRFHVIPLAILKCNLVNKRLH